MIILLKQKLFMSILLIGAFLLIYKIPNTPFYYYPERFNDKLSYSVFDEYYFNCHQQRLLFLCNFSLTKNWFRGILHIEDCSKDIIKIMPNSYTWRENDGKFTTDFRTHDKFSKRLYYSFKPLWWTFHGWDMTVGKILPFLNFGFDTLPTVYPNYYGEAGATTMDTRNARALVSEAWATIVVGAGTHSWADTTSGEVARIDSDSSQDKWSRIYRSLFLFNTSGLGAGATVTGAIFSISTTGKADGIGITPTLNIFSSNPGSNTVTAIADFQTIGSTPLCDTAITYSGFSAGYNALALNATGIALVSKTSITKFALREATYDATGTPPTWASSKTSNFDGYYADQTGTINDPKLVVTYTTSSIKTYNGLVWGSISTINGTAKASIKTLNGATAN